MKYYADHAVTLDKLPVINPGPGEYVHVMEGQRNGYNNLTIGITETFPKELHQCIRMKEKSRMCCWMAIFSMP